jgi:hypothetical protein
MVNDREATEAVRIALDGTAVAVWLAAISNILPSIATLFTVIWLGIQIWQSKTVQAHAACIRRRFKRKHGADDHVQAQDPRRDPPGVPQDDR